MNVDEGDDDDLEVEYAYTAENELAGAIIHDTSDIVIAYGYDTDGRRVQQDEDGTITNYVWDEYSMYGDVVMEYDDMGNPLVDYTLANGQLLAQDRGTPSYYLADGQGSTRALANGSGTITDTYDYTAFGELYASTGSTVNSYLYTGQQFDDLTELYSLRARYYSSTIGRFLSMDIFPVNFRNPIELNRYGYTANNPINGYDPTGNQTFFGYSKDTSERGAGTITAGQLIQRTIYQLWTRYYLAISRAPVVACFFGELGIELGLEILTAPQGGLPPDADVDLPGCAVGHDGDIDFGTGSGGGIDPPGGGGGSGTDSPGSGESIPNVGGNTETPNQPSGPNTNPPGGNGGGDDVPDTTGVGQGDGGSGSGGGNGNQANDAANSGNNNGSNGDGNTPGGGSGASGHFCSFSEDTLVATDDDLIEIGEIAVGDFVLAYDEETGEFGEYEVLATWEHLDDVALVMIDGETLETTLDHPFYTSEGAWVTAGDLEIGDLILSADGDYGEVESIAITDMLQTMFNLTVDEAHTYFVGDGQWLVHNKCKYRLRFQGSGGQKTDVMAKGFHADVETLKGRPAGELGFEPYEVAEGIFEIEIRDISPGDTGGYPINSEFVDMVTTAIESRSNASLVAQAQAMLSALQNGTFNDTVTLQQRIQEAEMLIDIFSNDRPFTIVSGG